MATEDEFLLYQLSVDQIEELARYIIDEFGPDLSPEELDESIGVVMENVPGIEMESTHETQRLVESIRRKYDDEIRNSKHQDLSARDRWLFFEAATYCLSSGLNVSESRWNPVSARVFQMSKNICENSLKELFFQAERDPLHFNYQQGERRWRP